MIRPLPYSPTVVFTAPLPPKRETAREPDKQEAKVQDVFNRMLAQQREAARHANKQQTQTQAPEPVPTPVPETEPDPAASTQAANEKDPATNGTTNPAAIRSAQRSRAQAGETDTKPAQIDPELPANETREGRKHKANEADVLARLFKTMPQQPTLPPRSPPIRPDDREDGGPIPLPPPTDEDEPILPGQFNPTPPVIECPVELPMLNHPAAAHANGDAGELPGQSDTQALQGREAAQALGTAQQAAQAAADGGAAGAIQIGADIAGAPAWAGERSEALAQSQAPATAANPAIGPVPAGTLAGAATAAGAAPARSAMLDARPGTEAFQAKFSAQVAVWVREGVHEAQLQLNPAEMGPVRVAILLEGAAAQVNFSAEHALTRQALEQALPSLAGSLAEAGFTLAGGGVFDQPQQPGRSTGEDGERSRARVQGEAGDVDTRGNAERASIARPRGVVDLVA